MKQTEQRSEISMSVNNLQAAHGYHCRTHIWHLHRNGLLPDGQKGCRRNTRGTKDQLLIDKMVLKNSRRHTSPNMAWIDYKKVYDMVLHSWILETVTLVVLADNIKRVLKNSMGNWKTGLVRDRNNPINTYAKTVIQATSWDMVRARSIICCSWTTSNCMEGITEK